MKTSSAIGRLGALLIPITLLVWAACGHSPAPPATDVEASVMTGRPHGAATPLPFARPHRKSPSVPIVSAVDSRSASQLAQIACAGADGWRCATAPKLAAMRGSITNTGTWTIADWYFDAANTTGCASDSNTCTSATCAAGGVGPCLTVNEMVNRWGTATPTLKQTTTLHILSAETLNQEAITLTPTVVPTPGGATGNAFAIIGTLAPVATFPLGTVTSKNRAAGTPLSAAGFTGVGEAVGQVVVNNVNGSRAEIVLLAGGIATLSQPLATLVWPASAATQPQPAENDTWATGQSVTVYRQPLLNLKVLAARGLDNTAAATAGMTWVQGILLPDTSGNSSSEIAPGPGQSNLFIDCDLNPYVSMGGATNYAASSFFIGSGLEGGGQMAYTIVLGGWSSGFGIGAFTSVIIDLDHMAMAGMSCLTETSTLVGYLYNPAGLSVSGGQCILDASLDETPGGAVWGAGTVDANSGGHIINNSGQTWTATLLGSGAIELDGATSGFHFINGSATWAASPSITPATLDAAGSISNPQTGSIYSTP